MHHQHSFWVQSCDERVSMCFVDGRIEELFITPSLLDAHQAKPASIAIRDLLNEVLNKAQAAMLEQIGTAMTNLPDVADRNAWEKIVDDRKRGQA